MRLALIGCMVMNREISHLAAESPHVVRTWWLRQGLHDTPDLLRTELQRTLDGIEQAFTPSLENYDRRLAEYATAYGEENASFLMECESSWMTKYRHCGFISCPLGDRAGYEDYTRQASRDFNWQFHRVEGSMEYLNALVNGPWDDVRFLTCPPRCRIEADFSDRKFRSVPLEPERQS